MKCQHCGCANFIKTSYKLVKKCASCHREVRVEEVIEVDAMQLARESLEREAIASLSRAVAEGSEGIWEDHRTYTSLILSLGWKIAVERGWIDVEVLHPRQSRFGRFTPIGKEFLKHV